MLTINLLPESARNPPASFLTQFHRTPFMWLVISILVMVPLGLWAFLSFHRQQLARLEEAIQVLEPKKRAVDELQRSLQQRRVEETAFRDLEAGQSQWAKRLNVLSDLVPDGVWLTELVFDPLSTLVIRGAVMGESGSEMARVGRFVQELNTADALTSLIKDIQIESLMRVQDGDLEIVQFTLSCTLREARALP